MMKQRKKRGKCVSSAGCGFKAGDRARACSAPDARNMHTRLNTTHVIIDQASVQTDQDSLEEQGRLGESRRTHFSHVGKRI